MGVIVESLNRWLMFPSQFLEVEGVATDYREKLQL